MYIASNIMLDLYKNKMHKLRWKFNMITGELAKAVHC